MKKIIFLFIAVALIFAGSCRDENAVGGIEFLSFVSTSVNMTVGMELAVGIRATPVEYKNSEAIVYSVSDDRGNIEIINTSNDGVAFRGKLPGDAVIVARTRKATAYLMVRVEGGDFIAQPYIIVQSPVIEIAEGEMRHIQVNLYGGTPLDYNQFEYSIEDGKNNIRIDPTMNSIVIHGLERGNQRITVTHPRAEYPCELLVFVRKDNENVKFITGDRNVILVQSGGQYVHFTANLFGGNVNDNRLFEYEIVEGGDVFEYISNNETVNVRGMNPGTGILRIRHPNATDDMYFDVRIISVEGDNPYIVVDKTFLMLELGQITQVKADVINPKTASALNEFNFEIDDGGKEVIRVIQTNNEFSVYAVEGGLAKVILKNDQAEYDREILVFVRTDKIYRDDYYITTNQNVIQTQVGDPDIELQMLLVGGNNADANGFSWEVSDGTIIELNSVHGTVRGNIIERSSLSSMFMGVAMITPKRAGVVSITISHTKSEVTASVLVKVYPKGTFSGPNVLVRAEGLIKVLLGSPETVNLEMVSGSAAELGEVDWSTADTNIAGLDTTLKGRTNVLVGNSSGTTKMRVENGNLRLPHESIVLVGTQAELDMANLIYVDSVYQTVATEQVVRIEVKNTQNTNLTGFSVNVADNGKLYAVMVGSQLVLQGKEPGETTVNIKHPSTTGQDEGITLYVRVENSRLTIDKPYYITGPNIVGVVNNDSITVRVSLEGAHNSLFGGIKWEVEDQGIIDIVNNGDQAIITGRSIDRQVTVRVSHEKSENVKSIIIYTVATADELNNKIVLGVDKRNHLLTVGEDIFVSLVTNANDTQKQSIEWSTSDASVVWVDGYYDSAHIRAIGEGFAEVRVQAPGNIIPLSIFVSVVFQRSNEQYISHPPIVEILNRETRILSVNTRNLSEVEMGNITWRLEDGTNNIAIEPNGEKCYIIGRSSGVGYMIIEQTGLRYKQRVLVLCAESRAELESMKVITVDKTYYRMNVGEEVRVNLGFGSGGFPEQDIQNIVWGIKGLNTGAVQIVGSGKSATIVARNEGRQTITIGGGGALNTLEIEFEIYGKDVPREWYEFRGHEKTKGILIGEQAQITMRYYLGSQEITTGYSMLSYENQDDTVVDVARAENVFNLTALKGGTSKLVIRHDDFIKDPANILVYTAATQAELDAFYPLVADKNNFLIRVGETVDLNITTDTEKDGLQSDPFSNIAQVTWSTAINGNSIDFQSLGKKQARVTGRNVGDAQIIVRHKNVEVERIFITVVANNNVDLTKRINTENIIGMVNGTSRITTVVTNLTMQEEAALLWESTNPAVVRVTGNGKSATLEATGVGEAYVIVNHGNWLKRHILVYVCGTEAEVSAYKAMNMENQYVRLGIGKSIILPMYFAPNKPAQNTTWTDVYGNRVAEFTELENGSKIEVKGLSEGVAVFDAMNAGRSRNTQPVRIYVEVSGDYIMPPAEPELKYLTTSKMIYLLDPTDPNAKVDIYVSGIGMTHDELRKISWGTKSGNQSKVTLFPNTSTGTSCQVFSNGVMGEETITVFHPAAGSLEIKILLTDVPELEGMKMIQFDDTVVMGMGGEIVKTVSVNGVLELNPALLQVTGPDKTDIIQVVRNGLEIKITALKAGQSTFRITHPDADIWKDVLVIVSSDASGLLYFTTQDNFNVLNINEYKNVAVTLVGMDEVNNDNYIWTVLDGGSEYIELIKSGNQARLRGLKPGVAAIRVSHPNGYVYPVTMYARVSQIDTVPVFITTTQNIVQLVQNTSMNVSVELKNGTPLMESLFSWEAKTPGIIEVVGAGSSAIVRGLSPGIGRIQVTNQSSLNILEILVMVDPVISNNIYIDTQQTFISMKPGESGRRVAVSLVNGLAEDRFNFKWESNQMMHHNSINRMPNGESRAVISITPGGDACFIQALEEGEATIVVSHPKTNHRLEIRVDVKYFDNINFVLSPPTPRQITINMGETRAIPVEAPTGVRVFYEVRNANPSETKVIAEAAGTNTLCIVEGIANGNGTSPGLAYLTAYNASGTMYDEIIVQVLYVDNFKERHIRLNSNLETMNRTETSRTIFAYASGFKDNGDIFTDEDNDGLKWMVPTGSANIIGVYPPEGRNVSITPKAVGDAEVHITHPDMPGYVKRLYVRVIDDDTSFSIEPTLLVMQKGQHVEVNSTIGNTNFPDYDNKVRWELLGQNELEPAVRMIVQGNPNESKGRSVVISSLNEGEAILRAIYNESVIKTCQIFVEKEKALEIINQVSILPDQKMTIPYFVVPANSEVKVFSNTDAHVHFHHDVDKNEIQLTGQLTVGYTNITLEANGITRHLTVITNTNYQFKSPGIFHFVNGEREYLNVVGSSLRGRPYVGQVSGVTGGPYFIEVEITPPEAQILELSSTTLNRSRIANIVIDAELANYGGQHRLVRVDPINAGSAQLVLYSPYYGESNSAMHLVINLFFNYDKLDVEFDIFDVNAKIDIDSNNNDLFPRVEYGNVANKVPKSSFDKSGNAVRIADGEVMWLYPVVDETKYPRHGLRINNVKVNWIDNQYSVNGKFPAPRIVTRNNRDYVQLNMNTLSDNVSVTGADVLRGVTFLGTLEIEYSYPYGLPEPSSFRALYMLYYEEYNRVRN